MFHVDSGSRALEVVVVGAGRMGREHSAAIAAAGDKVMAFLDSDLDRAASAATSVGAQAASVGPDLRSALEPFVSAGASALLVASPSAFHLAHTEAAQAFGLPVLLEKPPWVPGQDPAPLLAAKSSGAVIAVGMTTRFNPGVQAVRRAVQSGAIGTVVTISDRVAFTLVQGDLAEWYFDAERSGGGVLVTNGVHSLDRLAWVLGQRLDLRSVRLSSQYLQTCEDTAVLELSAGAIAVHMVELWGPGPVPPSELVVIGTRGSCWTDAHGNWRLSCLDDNTAEDRAAGYSELSAQWRSFRRLVLYGEHDGVLPEIDELLGPMNLLDQAIGRQADRLPPLR